MWYLKYDDGFRDVVVPMFIDRFHTMNAGTYTTNDNKHVLQSYQTPVAYWMDVSKTNTGFEDGERLLVVSPFITCSASTRRQVSRWLSENGFPSYRDIKKHIDDMGFGEIDYIDGQLVQYVDMKTFVRSVCN